MWQRLSSSSDYDTLREHLESGHRALLSLVGAPAWALETSSAFFHWAGIEQYQIASNSKTLSSNVILPSVAYQYLGRQFGGLFFDLSDALHPDALAALIGCVTGGGLVILYWGDSLETRPVETHLKVETVSMAEIGHRLRQRVLKFAQTAEHFCLFATDPIDLLKKPFRTRMDPRPIQWTNDQEIALAKILKVTLGRRRRPLMLEAPRGRGKSTILAEAILQTIAQKNCGITVITPHRFSSLPLVRRLEDRLGIGLEYGATVSLNTASTLTMLTMEQALSWSLNTEIIIVDEAACFPVHVLLDLANQTSRIVFSTTTSGYEGTGQGFRLRFEPSLSARYPNRKRLTMTQPVRWKSDDPVEAWVHRTLCLSDSTADIAFSHQEVTISPLSQDELSTSDDCLQAVSELLARAHHRTTPSDLHRIMDAPNHSLWVARAGKSIVGVCVVSREGGLSDDMVEPVFRGERRPKGHFIPETLSVHAAQKMAVKQRFWRVVRIAVDGNFRRHKVASRLLSTIEVEATRLGVDALGASFGATESLLSFWSSVGFSIVRLGVRRGRSSGLYSVLVLRPTSNEGRTLLTALRERYHQYFPECLSDGLRNLEWSVVRGLFADRDCLNENISELDADDTRRFVGRQQSFEIVSPSIKRVMTSLLSEAAENGDDTKWAIVVQKVFQHKPWDSLSIQGKAIDSRGIGHEHLRKAVEYFWNQ